jgi:hypothetical protein
MSPERCGRSLGGSFGDLPEVVLARVKAAKTTDIERWAMRILTATALQDVFADDGSARSDAPRV